MQRLYTALLNRKIWLDKLKKLEISVYLMFVDNLNEQSIRTMKHV